MTASRSERVRWARWTAADDAMRDFLADLAASPSRMRMVRAEQRRLVPPSARRAEAFQDKTEQLAKFLRESRGIGVWE